MTVLLSLCLCVFVFRRYIRNFSLFVFKPAGRIIFVYLILPVGCIMFHVQGAKVHKIFEIVTSGRNKIALYRGKRKDFFYFLQIFFAENLHYIRIISYLCTDSNSPKGWRVETYWKKDVYERYLRRADLANQSSEETQPKRPHWVYCALASLLWGGLNISRRGLSRVAYPEQGNARARTWDKRK